MIRILVMVAAVSVVAVPAVEGPNLVPNPGFDTDTLGTDWVNYSADSMPWLGTDGNVSGSGNGCVEFGTTSNNGGVVNVGTSLVAVTENTEYLVSGVARVPSDSVGSWSVLWITWFDDQQYSIGSSQDFYGVGDDQWNAVQGTVTSFSGAAFASVRVGVITADSGTGLAFVRWDDVSLVSAATPEVFSDGFEGGTTDAWSP
jgi:hypothetical protein